MIHSKIQDALEMRPASLTSRDDAASGGAPSPPCTTVEEKHNAISSALTELLDQPRPLSVVVFSDSSAGKFVQFAASDHSLLFDLPSQTLDESEFARAAEYFTRARRHSQGREWEASSQSAAVAVEDGFQLHVDSVEQAARIALQVFDQVYGLPDDFPMAVERV